MKLIGSLPPVWIDDKLRTRIQKRQETSNQIWVVFDDDPTGTQTMQDVWVLTRWDLDDLITGLRCNDPALFILTNSRSLPENQARRINKEIVDRLLAASRLTGKDVQLISRSDSTLRGHFQAEVDVLRSSLLEDTGHDLDGTCLIPFFEEGGRYTIGDVQWVRSGVKLVPAHATDYSADPVFGYQSGHLPTWIEEKTQGRVSRSEVLSISIDTLRLGGPKAVAKLLRPVQGNQYIVVNAVQYQDLYVFIEGMRCIEAEGKRFLFRTAASFVKAVTGIESKPLLHGGDLVRDRVKTGGLIIFGSHVEKSNLQLEYVLREKQAVAIELSTARVFDKSACAAEISRIIEQVQKALSNNRDVLIYTSREVIVGGSYEANLKIGQKISNALVDVIRSMQIEPRYMLAKGGITASDIATKGMGVRKARVLGQILPGVPVWRLGVESKWPELPYIVFPGNVGDANSIAEIVQDFHEER
jgi:uncharacterized protein YgbK (DUF1537 family)